MKHIVTLALAFLLAAAPAFAGTDTTVVMGGSCEAPATSGGVRSSSTGGANSLPYTVADFDIGQSMYCHFPLPPHFNAAVTPTIAIEWFPETDATTVTHKVCWAAGVTAMKNGAGGFNMQTTSLSTLTSYANNTVFTIGQFQRQISSLTQNTVFDGAAAAQCTSACQGADTVIQLQRVACTGGNDATGLIGVKRILVNTGN